jgi:hypothetical protein
LGCVSLDFTSFHPQMVNWCIIGGTRAPSIDCRPTVPYSNRASNLKICLNANFMPSSLGGIGV